MFTLRRLFFAVIFTVTAIASWEWVTIERGTYTGQGMSKDRWTAINKCSADMDKQFVALAQKCCENSDTVSPNYRGRCEGGAGRPRSFDGGLRAYFCWPSPTMSEYFPATGYYYVAHTRKYTCQELQDLTAPTPIAIPISKPTVDDSGAGGKIDLLASPVSTYLPK